MRPTFAALALVVLLLAGCVSAPKVTPAAMTLSAASVLGGPKTFGAMTHKMVDAPVAGTQNVVHIDYWLPADPRPGATTSAAGPFPVVADISPYYDDYPLDAERRPQLPGYVTDWVLKEMVPRGFVFAAVDLSGSAGSTGCWDFMGPQEIASVAAGIEWLGTQPWSNGKVGTVGLSYDGMTQIMALAKKAPHLAAAVPESPLTSSYNGIYVHGAPILGFWQGAQGAYEQSATTNPPVNEQERVPNWAARQPAAVQCDIDNEQNGVADLGQYNAYYKARDFQATANASTVPIFYTQGFLDHAVLPFNAFPYVDDYAGPKTVWLGQWIHTWPNATYSGRTDFYLELHQFLSHYLAGTPAAPATGFLVQDSDGRWRSESQWPPADAAPLSFRLADGKLSDAPDAAPGKGASFLDDGRPVEALAGNGAFLLGAAGGTPLPNGALWRSAPLATDAWISGMPTVSLNVSSSGPRGQVVAELLDCDGGTATAKCSVVTRGAMNLAQRNGNDKSENMQPGVFARAAFPLFPQDHVVHAGHVVALRVSGSDGDYFGPEATRNQITISESASAPSTLALPLITRASDAFSLVACGSALKDQPCYDGARRDEGWTA